MEKLLRKHANVAMHLLNHIKAQGSRGLSIVQYWEWEREASIAFPELSVDYPNPAGFGNAMLISGYISLDNNNGGYMHVYMPFTCIYFDK